MSLVFEKIPQTLASGQQCRLDIAGDFFRLSVAPYPVSVSLIKNLRVIGTMQNMLAGDYVKDIEFDGVIVTNGTTAQDVTLQIAGGGAGSDRVLGEVSVINGEIARVKADGSFIGLANQAAVAGQFSSCQLMNPAGSGKNVILNAVAITSMAASLIGLKAWSTPLLTDMGAGYSKRQGGAASAAHVRTDTNAAQVGVFLGLYGIETAGKSQDFRFTEPLLLPPGYGVTITGQTVNVQILATFQWNEE